MIVERYLDWAATAPAHLRAEAAGDFARTYLFGELDPHTRSDVESVLTRTLDDPSLAVRCAVAEALAGSPDAPHAIVYSLAQDAPDVAEPILRRSPLLSDLELVDLMALGCLKIQRAVARRAHVSAPLAAAMGEVALAEACLALVENPGARILPTTAARIAARHGAHGGVRDSLIARADLGPEIRQMLMRSLADTLSSFVAGCGWLQPDRARRAADEACDRGVIAIAAETADARGFARHLADRGVLSPSLALRALLSGDLPLFEAALAALSGRPAERIAGFVRDFEGRGFAALFAEAGLPKAALPAFRAALSARREVYLVDAGSGAALSRRLVERALAACDPAAPELAHLRSLLRRFAAEAARDQVRRDRPASETLAAA